MKNMNWLYFALISVSCWGLYGIFLHAGQAGMADKELGRYKAFLFVGIAYFLVAVLAPLVVLLLSKNMDWNMPAKGMWLSLLAGTLGAFGAFGVLLAMGSGAKIGMPPAIIAVSVMSIIFAGAPIVNAIVSIAMHPPKGGLAAIPWQFVAGILIAATGTYMVTKFKPIPGAPPAKPVETAASEK
ncbi:hypothetical protein [Haloferula sp. A504]|uniref:hypothetical protein n=1 Tax=Haloferula sp. A504 TaxID=3373601 RepID=UPI0031C11228|nr:hypothetical protein [Verrucomicrobiaceae bacterium E54]